MEKFKELLGEEIVRINQAIEEDLAELSDQIDPLLEEVLRYSLFNGGKRVRPLLVLLASRFCGKDNEQLYRLAVGFEYLHVATLMHDDVIDRADTRRGKDSANKKFGLVAAILAGDFLLARAMTMVGEIAGQQGLSIFCDATRAMVDGEFVQLRNNEQYELSEQKYFEAIQGKTAQFISAACEVGAVFASASAQEQQAFKIYGSNLGAAFQIVDDLLDYLGDTQKTGKQVGNDLVEGKVTLPLILSLKQAEDDERRKLLELLGDETQRQNSFGEVVQLVEENGGFSASRNKAEQLVEEGLAQLSSIQCKEPLAAEILTGLARYVLARNK